MKKLLFSILVLGVMASCLMAITGASVTTGNITRWTAGVTAGSVTTQGGNITGVNIASVQLTSKWADFYGNVSGSIILGSDNATVVYRWTYAQGAGEVCVSNNTAQPFTTIINATPTTIDSAFSYTSGLPDNAASTFNGACPAMTVNAVALGNFTAAVLQGTSSFTTCAATTAGATAAANHIFCTNINSTGKNYASGSNNYEIMIPATGSSAYSFYAELS